MKIFTLLTLCIFLSFIATTSCTKNANEEPGNFSGISNNSNSAHPTATGNFFGVLTNAAYSKQTPKASDTLTLLSFEKKLELASYYGVKYIRMSITHDAWVASNGSKNFIDNFQTACNEGFSVLLNVNYNAPSLHGAQNFASTAEYGNFLTSVLNSISARDPNLKPALVVVENEEANPVYYINNTTSTVDSYVNLLKTAIAICAPRSIKVTNGGITSYLLTLATWDWLRTKYGSSAANTWASNVMAPNFYSTINSTLMANYITLAKYTINKYSSLPLSYVNIHWYEPLKASQFAANRLGNPYFSAYSIDSTQITAGALDSCVSYLNASFNHISVITNETGQLSKSNRLTSSILRKYINYQATSANFPIVSWYDGDGGGVNNAIALHNAISTDSFTVRSSGLSFHNHLQQ
ncbi:MAG TPA: hypothetical protein VHB70_03385 [Parafilimonas sp.]|nr:hypothetical protein [Parafilimonas sp.]